MDRGGCSDDTNARLSKGQLYRFFDDAEEMMTSDETKAKLRELIACGQDAGEAITEMQKEVLVNLGIDGDFGMEFMGRVSEHYQTDTQFMTRFFAFVQAESNLLDEVESDPETLAEMESLQKEIQTLQTKAMEKLKAEGAAPSSTQEMMLYFQKQRNELLVQFRQSIGIPSDVELEILQQRDFLRFAINEIRNISGITGSVGTSSIQYIQHQAPQTQTMD
mmetsp:Transcript_14458/g.27781  ORF Transcript_14458/g.27781 Transcript_14458/m.27781 type:complete len:220 (-) Transcript_14458:230-889(-)